MQPREPPKEAGHMPPPQVEIELVARYRRDERRQDDGRQLEVPAMREQAAEHEHGLTLRERAEEERGITVGIEKVFEIHDAIGFGAEAS